MESKISNAIALQYPPVALVWTDQKPEGALQFKEQKWGCIMPGSFLERPTWQSLMKKK